MTGWWAAATERELTVACQGEQHRLRWRAGGLHLDAHPDLDAELALIGFGGEEPPCLARYRLWQDAVDDGGFLAEWVDETKLSPAWFSWLAMALERMRSEGFHEFLRALPPKRAQRMGEFLHHFPVPFIDLAAATVSGRLDADDPDRDQREPVPVCTSAPAHVAAGTANRLRRAFVDAVGGRQLAVGAAALVPLDIAVRAGDPHIEGRVAGEHRGVIIEVAPTWLHRVWAAGAAVIDGQLVLAIDGLAASGDGQLEATASVVTWAAGEDGRLQPACATRPVVFGHGGWSSPPAKRSTK